MAPALPLRLPAASRPRYAVNKGQVNPLSELNYGKDPHEGFTVPSESGEYTAS
jgi:hypothetical protein